MTATGFQHAGRIVSKAGAVLHYLVARKGSLCIDLGGDCRKTVLVAGSGRGGTTWLSEIINADNTFRDVFEPFNPGRVAILKHFCRRQYLRPENDDARYLIPASQVFSGRVRGDWTDRYNRRIICFKRVVKDIRVNLMLKWVHNNFSGMPIIFLLRHPFSVALSRVFLGWKSSVALGGLLSQDLLVEDYLRPFMPTILSAKTDFEQHLIVWCIENHVPLRSLQRNDALVVFYENLCSQPEIEVKRISEYLRLQSYEHMIRRVGLPSSQTRKKTSAIMVGEDLISPWKKHLSKQVVTRAREVLDVFELSHLYGSDSRPLLNSDLVFGVTRGVREAG